MSLKSDDESEQWRPKLAPLFEGPAAPFIFQDRDQSKSSLRSWSWPKGKCGKHDRVGTLVTVICTALGPFPIAKLPPDSSIDVQAQYIIHQYLKCVGGFNKSFRNAYASGRIRVQELDAGDGGAAIGVPYGGTFVLWEMMPDKWHVELAAAGVRVRSGSDGRVTWRQSPRGTESWRGPVRPPRRLLYGVDPRVVASMFSTARWSGAACVEGCECVVLRHVSESYDDEDLRQHVAYAYFDQRTGFLIRLKDTLTLIPGSNATSFNDDDVVPTWKVTTDVILREYRRVGHDPALVPHQGTCITSILCVGDNAKQQVHTEFEESWWLEDFDYNVPGLSKEFFMAPFDLAVTIREKDDLSLCANARPQHDPGKEKFFSTLASRIFSSGRQLPFGNDM